MWYECEIILRNYIPDKLTKGMLFFNIYKQGTEFENYEILKLEKLPRDEKAFIALYGYPIEILLKLNEKEILNFDTMPLFDFEELEEYKKISLVEINTILNNYKSVCEILYDEQNEPVLIDDKVILRYYQEEEEYEE